MQEPGGYLQWDEVDTLGSYIKTVNPSTSTDTLESIRQRMSGPGNSRGLDKYVTYFVLNEQTTNECYSWKSNLPEVLNQNGFQDSRLYRHEIDPTMARYWNDV